MDEPVLVPELTAWDQRLVSLLPVHRDHAMSAYEVMRDLKLGPSYEDQEMVRQALDGLVHLGLRGVHRTPMGLYWRDPPRAFGEGVQEGLL